jgi:hypothetical protein
MARRDLMLRVAFAPTRLSEEYLRTAYEIAIPVVERAVLPIEPSLETGAIESRATKRDRARGGRR